MIIIAVYVRTENLSRSAAESYLNDVRSLLDNCKSGAIYHIIPTHNQETKMELIYPPAINTDILKEVLERIDSISK